MITVNESVKKEELNEKVIKHPLQHKWCLWFYKNDKSKLWEENILEVTSFDTVEDFWALYNHIEVPSKLRTGCDYSVFKSGIKPMWEDEKNQHGGRWLINIGRHLRNVDLDIYWLEILLCLIGEGFDDCSNEICGAVVQIRNKADKIGVWTADFRNAENNIKIGKKLKERLNIHRGLLGYEASIFVYHSHISYFRLPERMANIFDVCHSFWPISMCRLKQVLWLNVDTKYNGIKESDYA